jgi:hypothetical protein
VEQLALRSLRALTVASGLIASICLICWLVRWPLTLEIAVGLTAIIVAAAILVAFRRWPTQALAAREADKRLGLEELMLTAWDSMRAHRTGGVAQLQVSSAVETGHARLPEWPINGPAIRREGLRALACASLALALFLFASFSDQLPLPRPDLAALRNPDIEPDAQSSIPDPPPLPKPDTAAGQGAVSPVVQALDDLRRARERNGVSKEDAERRVSQAASEIQRQANQSSAQRQDLNRLGRGLGQTSAGREAGESIQRGGYQDAASQLADLGDESDQLSQAAKDQLARELRAAAAETSQDRLLADRERRAADALSGRDYTQQRRALRELGEEVARAGNFVVPQQELAEGMSRVREAQQELGQTPAPGQSDDRPPANASGQGSNQSPANSRSPQGQQQAGQSARSGGAVPGNGESGTGQAGNGSSPGGDQAGENQLGATPRLETVGRRVEVPVKVGRGPLSSRPGTDDPVDSEDAPETATSVGLNQPQDPSSTTAERNEVPSDRRQTVRDYFRGEAPR